MDGFEISRMVSSSAGQLYDYVSFKQYVTDPPLGMSETQVSDVDVGDGYAVLYLAARLSDASGLILRVDSDQIDEDAAGFTRYDEISKTIVIRPGEEVLERISDGARVSVLTDMKFLISAVREFYERYGDMIRIPDVPSVDAIPVFPTGAEANAQQVAASHGVLKSSMSYVWGAPGTGKTQFVLSSCIRGCLAAGERVAIFAPTNNSVEQVLRGVLNALPEGECPDGIVRLGIPTRDFLREHPSMCEDRQAQRRLDDCLRSLDNLEEVLFERACDSVRDDLAALLHIEAGFWDRDDLVGSHPELAGPLDSVLSVCRMRSDLSLMLEADDIPLSSRLSDVSDGLYRRQRPAASISEYDDWSDGDIAEKIAEIREEADAFRSRTTGNRISAATIVAGTPHQFISRFRPKGSAEDGRMELDVDRIFLDEAGYCGLIPALTLFSCGVPVSMLGDHMQLPPVSQLDREEVLKGTAEGRSLGLSFLWDLSALHSEAVLTDQFENLRDGFLNGDGPVFGITSRHDLTSTHRFGRNLGSVLDSYVYHNGVAGSGEGNLGMYYIDAKCDRRQNRENKGEAMAIRSLIDGERMDPADICILTPYSMQCLEIKRCIPKRYHDCVMTVHGSQGREWDTVILSVADNGTISRDVPFRFTSSETDIGMRVINTAVSRAKRRLILVCDRDFWIARGGELLCGLLRESERYGA